MKKLVLFFAIIGLTFSSFAQSAKNSSDAVKDLVGNIIFTEDQEVIAHDTARLSKLLREHPEVKREWAISIVQGIPQTEHEIGLFIKVGGSFDYKITVPVDGDEKEMTLVEAVIRKFNTANDAYLWSSAVASIIRGSDVCLVNAEQKRPSQVFIPKFTEDKILELNESKAVTQAFLKQEKICGCANGLVKK